MSPDCGCPARPRDVVHSDGVSAVVLRAQQGQGIAEALLQEAVGEPSVGQGAAAPDLVEEGGVGAAVTGVVSVVGR